ncbi:MAG: adenosine monophosphate-protein transferase, partial [Nitrososphaerota archaeon]|nr:adenosine monophosphate-protein transferase [Nitrososphaerota archaeon]
GVDAGAVYCSGQLGADPATGKLEDGVIDGGYPKGEEGPEDRKERYEFLRKLGYKR